MMIKLSYFLLSAFLFLACNSQQPGIPANSGNNSASDSVGGPFENKHFSDINKPAIIMPYDTSPGWSQQGNKILITGRIFQPDGVTPAPGIELYYYHTDVGGRYIHKADNPRSFQANELGQTHGYIRGWIQTDSLGRYFMYTVRPGHYPNESIPEHIHLTIQEPQKKIKYYIDDVVFDDDELLTSSIRNKAENRGGTGIVVLTQRNGIATGERNIIMGLNIPNYPK